MVQGMSRDAWGGCGTFYLDPSALLKRIFAFSVWGLLAFQLAWVRVLVHFFSLPLIFTWLLVVSISYFVAAATKFSRCSSNKEISPLLFFFFFISRSRSLWPFFSFSFAGLSPIFFFSIVEIKHRVSQSMSTSTRPREIPPAREPWFFRMPPTFITLAGPN